MKSSSYETYLRHKRVKFNSRCVKNIPRFFWSKFLIVWIILQIFHSNTVKYRLEKAPQGYDQKCKLFRTNSFVLPHSSAKTIYNEQLLLKPPME